MKERGTIIINFLEDRGFKKVRVNIIKNNHVIGFLKPV
jgi:hypothetical protein